MPEIIMQVTSQLAYKLPYFSHNIFQFLFYLSLNSHVNYLNFDKHVINAFSSLCEIHLVPLFPRTGFESNITIIVNTSFLSTGKKGVRTLFSVNEKAVVKTAKHFLIIE